MKKRQLGKDGPEVSALGFGCLSFGGIFGAADDAESLSALDAAWEAGITFFDIANIYGNGRCEEVLGKWLSSRGHRPLIATKAGILNGPPRGVSNEPAYLRAELEGSLKRMGVDHVQLFYAHRHDSRVPAEELAGTMQRLEEEGKILGYGLSEVAPYTLERAHAVHPVTAVQNEYSLWSRQPELGMIQLCARLGVAFVAFSPLLRGAFGTPLLEQAQMQANDLRHRIPRFWPENWPHNRRKLLEFQAYAQSRGYDASALALAWVLDQAAHIIPIPGTRFASHLKQWANAPEIDLTDDDRSEIKRIMPVGWAWGDRYDDELAASVERFS